MLACGAIGFADDLIKLRHQPLARARRPAGRCCCCSRSRSSVGLAAHHQKLRHDVFVPVLNEWIPLGWGWYVLVFFIIAGAANAVNLTDGLDGLAAGTSIIALFTLTAMAVTIYIRSGAPGRPDRDAARRGVRRRGGDRRRDRLPLVQRASRPRCSWATPARWRSAARSPRWRSSSRSSCCSCSSAASS